LALLFGIGLRWIHFDTKPLSFLPDKSEARVHVRRADELFPGGRFLSLLVQKTDGTSFSDRHIETLDWIESTLSNSPHVYSVTGASKILQMQSKLSRFGMNEFSFQSGEDPFNMLKKVVSVDRTVLRFLMETDLDGSELLELLANLRSDLEAAPEFTDLRLTFAGFERVMAEQAQTITQNVIFSVLYTIVIIFLVLLAATQSLRVSLVGLVPNLIPILAVFGLIGWIFDGVSLGAALVSCAALGIAVDNTFHFIISWQASLRSGTELSEATDSTLQNLLPAFLYTTLILTVGFSALLLSDVEPTFQFGLLLGTTLCIGLLSDITVLPVLLKKFCHRKI
jgi:predicted RND superfamily exporter protein